MEHLCKKCNQELDFEGDCVNPDCDESIFNDIDYADSEEDSELDFPSDLGFRSEDDNAE